MLHLNDKKSRLERLNYRYKDVNETSLTIVRFVWSAMVDLWYPSVFFCLEFFSQQKVLIMVHAA